MLATSDARARLAWVCLRVTLAGLIAAHGWMRFAGGGVVPFGGWLTSQGVPAGFAVAAAITALEVLGTPLYALGRSAARRRPRLSTLGAWSPDSPPVPSPGPAVRTWLLRS